MLRSMAHLPLALLVGILQGLIEWLPVSSKTMNLLVLAGAGMPISQAYAIGLIANFGSFFAALYYFRREALAVLRGLLHPFGSGQDAQLFRFVFLATLATGIVGIPIYEAAKHLLSVTGGSLAMLAVGLLLLLTAWLSARKERLVRAGGAGRQGIPASWPSALVGGLQGLAALPGMSRSGVTVTPLLAMGYSAAEALRLSFTLDVVALLGAAGVPLLSHGGVRAVHALGVGDTVLMLLVAAVVSFLTIGAVLRIASRLRTSVATLIIALITLAVAVVGLSAIR